MTRLTDGIQIDEHVDPLITPYRTAVSNSMTLEQLKSMPPSLLVKNLSPEVTVDALNEVCVLVSFWQCFSQETGLPKGPRRCVRRHQ